MVTVLDVVLALGLLAAGWFLYTPRVGKYLVSKQWIGRRDLSDEEAIRTSSVARGLTTALSATMLLDKALKSELKVPVLAVVGLVLFLLAYSLSQASLARGKSGNRTP